MGRRVGPKSRGGSWSLPLRTDRHTATFTASAADVLAGGADGFESVFDSVSLRDKVSSQSRHCSLEPWPRSPLRPLNELVEMTSPMSTIRKTQKPWGRLYMENVSFIDPFAAGDRPAVKPPRDPKPAPEPPKGPAATPPAVPTRGREHEVQRLIRDLAVLAARNKPPVA